MNEEKRLDEKVLEDVAGGLSGENMAEVGRVMRHTLPCSNCVKRGNDCPYHNDLETIHRVFGDSIPTCYTMR